MYTIKFDNQELDLLEILVAQHLQAREDSGIKAGEANEKIRNMLFKIQYPGNKRR